MRIGMLADVYKPHVSGVTHYIEMNKRQFEQAGHEVFVFTFGSPGFPDREPHIIRSPGLPLGRTEYYVAYGYSRRARELLQTMDIAHVQHPFLSGQLALRYCRPVRIPTVFTNHTRYDLYAQAYLPVVPVGISAGVLQAYMPRFCHGMDLVISPSAGMAEALRGMAVASPIEVVPNGVELQRFHTAQPLARGHFGFAANHILLVYAGRLATEKNLGFLLSAFQRVASALENVRLLVIGGGPRAVEEDLQRRVAELHIEDQVHFTGMVPYAELPSYMAMCDVFVTASVSESFGLSVVEAMAAGLPIVAVRSPGIADVVESGQTGLLSDHDLSSFASMLTRICLDREWRRYMGTQARQASTQYSIERTSRRLLDLYGQLVETVARRKGHGARAPAFLEDRLK